MERLRGCRERRQLCVLSTNVDHAVRGRSTLALCCLAVCPPRMASPINGVSAYDLPPYIQAHLDGVILADGSSVESLLERIRNRRRARMLGTPNDSNREAASSRDLLKKNVEVQTDAADFQTDEEVQQEKRRQQLLLELAEKKETLWKAKEREACDTIERLTTEIRLLQARERELIAKLEEWQKRAMRAEDELTAVHTRLHNKQPHAHNELRGFGSTNFSVYNSTTHQRQIAEKDSNDHIQADEVQTQTAKENTRVPLLAVSAHNMDISATRSTAYANTSPSTTTSGSVASSPQSPKLQPAQQNFDTPPSHPPIYQRSTADVASILSSFSRPNPLVHHTKARAAVAPPGRRLPSRAGLFASSVKNLKKLFARPADASGRSSDEESPPPTQRITSPYSPNTMQESTPANQTFQSSSQMKLSPQPSKNPLQTTQRKQLTESPAPSHLSDMPTNDSPQSYKTVPNIGWKLSTSRLHKFRSGISPNSRRLLDLAQTKWEQHEIAEHLSKRTPSPTKSRAAALLKQMRGW